MLMRPFFQGTSKMLTKMPSAWLKKSRDTCSQWRTERAVTTEYSSLLYIWFSPLQIDLSGLSLHLVGFSSSLDLKPSKASNANS